MNIQSIQTQNLLIALITSLLDIEKFPAELLARVYHQRWEVENTIDELKIHLVGRKTHIRSQKLGVWLYKKFMVGYWDIGQYGY